MVQQATAWKRGLHGFRPQIRGAQAVAGPTTGPVLRRSTIFSAMAEAGVIGLLVECRDEPGLLYRLTEAIFRHGANITYVAGGSATRESVAEIQLEVSGAPGDDALIDDVRGVAGVMSVTVVPTFQT